MQKNKEKEKIDVYVAGFESNSNGNTVGKLWKNGKQQVLNNNSGMAHSVFLVEKK